MIASHEGAITKENLLKWVEQELEDSKNSWLQKVSNQDFLSEDG
jgi:hypothetical protein